MDKFKDSLVINKLKKIFLDGDDAGKIKDFLKRGFSLSGEIVITSIFMFAQENNKGIDEVLQECEKEWERNWDNQHPNIRGNPNAPGSAGFQNRASLCNVYNSLGIKSPYPANS